jgi:hypothetical protein
LFVTKEIDIVVTNNSLLLEKNNILILFFCITINLLERVQKNRNLLVN